MNGKSNESNPCQLCKTSQNKDSWTENPGMLTFLYKLVFRNQIDLHEPSSAFPNQNFIMLILRNNTDGQINIV